MQTFVHKTQAVGMSSFVSSAVQVNHVRVNRRKAPVYRWRRQRDLQALKNLVAAKVQQGVQLAMQQRLEQSLLRTQSIAKCASALGVLQGR